MGYLKDYLSGIEFREKDAERVIKQFETDAYVIDGVIRWKSNDRIPPNDILELWHYKGKDFDYEKSVAISDHETTLSLRAYRDRMKNYSPSPEELSEMRSAFGSGAKVVDVITGKEIQL